MTQLRFETYQMPAASLGEENCLPDILNNKYIHTPIRVTDKISQSERKLIGKGMISTLLPYTIQDGYDRNRKLKDFPAAVLENDYLKAVFLPSLGGRLWSLFDKKQNRELLYCNSVFQPANLSLRNAWFSGGVEWNVGIKGHNPLTCSPLFACRCTNSQGEPVLKMYEYERIRGIVYSVCATLKDDVLLVHPIIENTGDQDTYMYWWSTIAVDEEEGLRVLSPAEETFVSYYDETGYVLDTNDLPVMHLKGTAQPVDVSYPGNIYRSGDFFYKIPTNRRKWIASVNQQGQGLLQFSDPILQGRKLFVWGQQQGGRHWNEWLSDRSRPYVEIQAGLLKTQLEHFVMEKSTKIQWTEGYCAIQADAQILHQQNYCGASRYLEDQMEQQFGSLEEDLFSIVTQEDPVYLGSGWGALENKIRAVPISDINRFPECSIGPEQADWLHLLNTGSLPKHDPLQPINGYVSGEFWENLLTKNLTDNWYDHYQLGVILCGQCKFSQAMIHFAYSNALQENPWALRNMAQIQKNHLQNTASAADHMAKAVALKNNYRPLLVDCADAFLADGRYKAWLALYQNLPQQMQDNGRLRFFTAVALIKLDKLDAAAALLTKDLVVDDLKEGEYSVSQLWIELYGKIMARDTGRCPEDITDGEVLVQYPLPYALDFRMH